MALNFAVLRPLNGKACRAFPDVVRYASNDPNYARTFNNEEIDLSSSAPQKIDWDNTVIELSLEKEKLPEFPSLGWRIGRGIRGNSRRNDICIAVPESTEVAARHCILYLHPRSGLLILEAGMEGDQPTYYLTEAREKIRMQPRQTLALTNASTSVIIAGFEYEIYYTVTEDSAKRHFNSLDAFLKQWHNGMLHPAGHYSPSMGRSNISYLGNYMARDDLGDGAFGHVSYGIELKSGDPVAIKEVRVTNSGERRAQLAEVDIHSLLQDSPLFLSIVDNWCAKHKLPIRDCPGHGIERLYVATELALFDFRSNHFIQLPDDEALEHFHQTLQGISEMHDRGVMHRDVSQANMMVVTISPPRAVIIDFGKACIAEFGDKTTIGPIATLAPEVWTKKYGREIDLWAWAYAAAQWLGYSDARESRNERISKARLEVIRQLVQGIAERNRDFKPHMSLFADLLCEILLWNSQERLTVVQALQHPVWTSLQGEVDGSNVSPPSKRTKLTSAPKSGTESTISTLPFSEETYQAFWGQP